MSLLQGCGRAAFVHVPPLGRPYSAGQLGLALRAVVLEMLAQLGSPAPQASGAIEILSSACGDPPGAPV